MRIHGHYLSYKQAIYTNVYNEKQTGCGKEKHQLSCIWTNIIQS